MDEKPELSPRDPPSATPMTRVIENIDTITTKKIEDLCSTLWASSSNAIHLGYLQDDEHRNHQVELVDCNLMPQEAVEVLNLEVRLRNKQEMRLSRQDRFKIASIVASSLLQLNSTPWLPSKLEKGMSSFIAETSSYRSIILISSFLQILKDTPNGLRTSQNG
jgi:hypothetical protein